MNQITDGDVLTACFTPRQLQVLVDHMNENGDAIFTRHAAILNSSPMPPHWAIIDVPALSPMDRLDIMNADTLYSSDELAAPHSTDDVSTALVRGWGLPKARAEAIANRVVTEDSQSKALTLATWQQALPDLPGLEDPKLKEGIARLLTESQGVISGLFGTTESWKDTLYEWMKLGAEMRQAKKREALQVAGMAYQATAAGLPEAGDPFEQGDEIGGDDLARAVNTLLGAQLFKTETGEPMDEDAARGVIREFGDALDLAATSPYHAYAEANPEQGGLFGDIFKGIKKAVKTVGSVVKAVAPMALTAAGTMFGGPVGGMLGSMGGKMVSGLLGGSRRRAAPMMASIQQAPAAYTQYGMPRMSSPNAMIANIINAIRNAGYHI